MGNWSLVGTPIGSLLYYLEFVYYFAPSHSASVFPNVNFIATPNPWKENTFSLLQSHGTAYLWASATEIRHQSFSFKATRKSTIEISSAIWVMCHLLYRNTTGIGYFLNCALEEVLCWKKNPLILLLPLLIVLKSLPFHFNWWFALSSLYSLSFISWPTLCDRPSLSCSYTNGKS